MNKKIVRMTESDLRNIVKESVGKIINEIGDTPKGQRALGALGQRHALRNPKYDARDTKSKEAKIYDYAKKARGGDTYDYKGTPQNPKYYDFANGAIDYINSHTDELAAAHRRTKMGESRMLKEWDDDYPVTVDDDENVYYGNYYYKTNDFKRTGQKFWVLTNNGTPEYAFVSPEEAAQYVVASIQDRDIEADVDEEQIYNEIMQSSDELGWYYKNYECTPTDVVKKKQ